MLATVSANQPAVYQPAANRLNVQSRSNIDRLSNVETVNASLPRLQPTPKEPQSVGANEAAQNTTTVTLSAAAQAIAKNATTASTEGASAAGADPATAAFQAPRGITAGANAAIAAYKTNAANGQQF